MFSRTYSVEFIFSRLPHVTELILPLDLIWYFRTTAPPWLIDFDVSRQPHTLVSLTCHAQVENEIYRKLTHFCRTSTRTPIVGSRNTCCGGGTWRSTTRGRGTAGCTSARRASPIIPSTTPSSTARISPSPSFHTEPTGLGLTTRFSSRSRLETKYEVILEHCFLTK